jgi:3-methyladenine DNA glycosylase AlkD
VVPTVRTGRDDNAATVPTMPDPALHLARLVRRGIAEIADPARAPRMQAYMRAAMPYRGVTSAPLRRLLRELYTTHPLPGRDAWRSCVLELWDHAGYREERYAAIALTSHRLYQAHQDPATLPLYRHLVVTGAWWDYVDPLATHDVGRILVAHADEVAPLIRAWSLDDDMWLRRTSILCQLHRGAGTDLALLSEVVEANLEGSRFGSQFFVRKAIGWELRLHARVDPDWVRAFVAGHGDRLSGLSRREALKHL